MMCLPKSGISCAVVLRAPAIGLFWVWFLWGFVGFLVCWVFLLLGFGRAWISEPHCAREGESAVSAFPPSSASVDRVCPALCSGLGGLLVVWWLVVGFCWVLLGLDILLTGLFLATLSLLETAPFLSLLAAGMWMGVPPSPLLAAARVCPALGVALGCLGCSFGLVCGRVRLGLDILSSRPRMPQLFSLLETVPALSLLLQHALFGGSRAVVLLLVVGLLLAACWLFVGVLGLLGWLLSSLGPPFGDPLTESQ